ncbi:MAG: helix-turn-helix domain-containing protein [Candidatus Fimenecus sp.]
MHYTQRMEDLRKDRDLKQEAVAIMLGITRLQYQLYESGKRKLPIDKLMQLCKFCNIAADYLLGFTNTPNPLPKK